MNFDFAYLVPIVAIIGGITYAIFNLYFKSCRQAAGSEGSTALTHALAESNATNAALLEKLTSLDTRLVAIERTLSEVG
ncbi:hypothetical protein SAMN05216368_107129 [Cryobacterium flavum]|uniref:Uncharacterized protein n=1 Tax=Cryobacterium flavum TaxID=1424659 RepID=A0A4R8V392_9MICO|nr:hypothetical protein [Cryobacterium flavum]TFB75613.1 hypothetical protein E3O21_12395 [Cryobacterium flavum]SDN77302.1 hypothetical protein SAMN05216368_107129 [Cryobacterium flavum]